jgi:hypothetical protein
VSEVEWLGGPGTKGAAAGEPTDLLMVERLVERLPEIAEIKAEQSWEWRQDPPPGSGKHAVLSLVEAVLVS